MRSPRLPLKCHSTTHTHESMPPWRIGRRASCKQRHKGRDLQLLNEAAHGLAHRIVANHDLRTASEAAAGMGGTQSVTRERRLKVSQVCSGLVCASPTVLKIPPVLPARRAMLLCRYIGDTAPSQQLLAVRDKFASGGGASVCRTDMDRQLATRSQGVRPMLVVRTDVQARSDFLPGSRAGGRLWRDPGTPARRQHPHRERGSRGEPRRTDRAALAPSSRLKLR